MLADCRKVWKQVSGSVYHKDWGLPYWFLSHFSINSEVVLFPAAVNNEANESGKTEFTLNLIKKN